MRLTRRAWGVGLTGLSLVALALLFDQPLLLAGASLFAAWLIANAWQFAQQLDRTATQLSIDHGIERDRVATDRHIALTLGVERPVPAPLHLEIEARPPVSTSLHGNDEFAVELPSGTQQARQSVLASWPHAGRFAFDPPTVSATDGLFESRFGAGPIPEITVTPRRPRELHVGVGGEPLTAAYGEHGAGQRGAGLEPAELREYVPGDAANRIDWKATARLAQPFVREFDLETERRTMLVFDHRNPMASGPEGETKLDYLREVALAYVDSARAFDDPLGAITIGDEGVTGRWPPEVDRAQYATLEAEIGRLEPTPAPGSDGSEFTSPAEARRRADRLADDSTPFSRTLRPYYASAETYVERIENEPLYRAVRELRKRVRGPLWTVILTDDSDRTGLEQAISAARGSGGRVIVYLAPSVLFEPGGLVDVEAAYDRYVDFEEFRRQLTRPDRVEVYEVAPGDRIEAVLSAGQRRRERGTPIGGR